MEMFYNNDETNDADDADDATTGPNVGRGRADSARRCPIQSHWRAVGRSRRCLISRTADLVKRRLRALER